ncbi:hypothetical protein CXB49_21440 [Chromobacterium sp. ATCC 53434]|uniref:glycine-rich domain-containing protein n=1 Tax=Chromobacterium sp. (strain ATCC 53434 / SC 14030) TaxID=2059672 RepID=UPI000C771069|nr:hypothetical protein [Chromobacterium sp. ATCC 53434]AUH53171.1 hypothetical protein CXB49_21440 [Chromobacterium sp. ATCC 53434]
MQDPIKLVPTPDQRFHDGNPATGELGTVVSADWLNTLQSATQSTQQEMLSVIANSGQKADPTRQDQLLQAVQNIAWGGNSKPTTLAGYGIVDGASKTDLQTAVSNLVAGAPGALNTLQELAAALGNDANYAATITKQLSNKADKAVTLAGYGIGDAQTKAQSDARYFQRQARFTSNRQFTVPDGVTRIYVSGCGGGGGGGGSGASSASVMAAGGGGGAGNHVMRQDYAVRPGQILNIVIGGGGSGGLGGPGNGATGSAGIIGTNGGATAIAEIGLNLPGGTGGGPGNTNGTWGNGASPGNGGPGMAPGTTGWSGPTTNMCYPGGLGGNSPFGGGGGTGWWYWAGGVSQNGSGFGSGGGGGFAGSVDGGIAGANGAPGVIFIEW